MGTGNANKKLKFEKMNLLEQVFIDTPGKCVPVNMENMLTEANEVLEEQSKPTIKVDRAVFIDHIPTGYI